MDVGLVVEAQDGLTWDLWRQIVRRADRLGFASIFRSDHYFIGQQEPSLDAFLSFVLAAIETKSVRFGPLVTPITFRRPADIARMSAQLDNLSGGRFALGLGIGWYRPEHDAYGIPFPPVSERFERLEEAIVMCRLLWGDELATFNGRHFSLSEVDSRPKPSAGRVPIIIGGTGERRTLQIVARYADEWCSECLSVRDYAHKVDVLARHCDAVSRDPKSIRRSMVIVENVVPSPRRVLFGAAERALRTVGLSHDHPKAFAVPARVGGLLVGGRQQIIDQLAEYSRLGLQEAIFRHFDLESGRVPEFLGSEILPAVGRL